MDIVAMHSANGNQTMSSKEIAELTGKRHDHVMRDIRVMLAEIHGEDGLPNFGASYLNEQNKPQPCFNLPKRETLILISGYSVKMRTRIIDRWQELEARQTLTPAQLILAQAQALVAQEQRVSAIEEKVRLIEATMPREQDYFTVIGWARYIGITISNSEALGLGRKCAKYSRDRGVSIGDTTDPRYGLVHTYHADICDAAFNDYFDAKAA